MKTYADEAAAFTETQGIPNTQNHVIPETEIRQIHPTKTRTTNDLRIRSAAIGIQCEFPKLCGSIRERLIRIEGVGESLARLGVRIGSCGSMF
jgi:hypothetical protein